jgi:hypothetical protein
VNVKLNAKTAAIVVVLYFIGSIAITLLLAIFLGGAGGSESQTNIEDWSDYSLVANLIVSVILLLVSLVLFKDSRKDIYFERTAFYLSKLYWAIPLVDVAVAVVALFNVKYSLISMSSILLVLLAALSIGFNEEVVTRGILLVGLRNDKVSEWKVYVITLVVFSLLHLINLIAGGNITQIIVQFAGGTIFYVARRVSNTLILPIIIHAFYDFAFVLLDGPYLVNAELPSGVLDIHLASFLILLALFILFIIFGRKLLKNETTGWEQN